MIYTKCYPFPCHLGSYQIRKVIEQLKNEHLVKSEEIVTPEGREV